MLTATTVTTVLDNSDNSDKAGRDKGYSLFAIGRKGEKKRAIIN